MSTPASPPPGPPCPRCGVPHGPDQEYCLECGQRLQPAGGVFGRLAALWQQRLGWYPGDWIWPVLLFLLLAVAGATAAIVLADAGPASWGADGVAVRPERLYGRARVDPRERERPCPCPGPGPGCLQGRSPA